MNKFLSISTWLALALPLITAAVIVGCGGKSHSGSSASVKDSVGAYTSANSESSIASAIGKVETAVGMTSPTSPYAAYAFSSTLNATMSSVSILERTGGYPITLGSLMNTWRTTPTARISVTDDVVIPALNSAIESARANPNDIRSPLLNALDLLNQDINDTPSLSASSKVDLLMGRLIAAWIYDHYGLASASPFTRDNAACQQCLDAHNQACQSTYDRQVAATDAFRSQMHSSIDAATWLSPAQRQSEHTKVDHDCNEENFNHSKELQQCQAGAADACKDACHGQS